MNAPPAEKSGCGKGCLFAVVGVLAFGGICLVGLFYFYVTAVAHLTAAQPQGVTPDTASPDLYRTAKLTLDSFRSAISANRDETIEFTGADLNALIAHDPDFASSRGRARFGIADSVMTLDLSVPITGFALPRLQGRWFNGSLRFTFNYEYDQFRIEPTMISANGWRMPEWLLTSSFSSSFSQSFSKSYHQAMQKNPRASTFWRHIRKIGLDGDKLVVTTQRVE